MINELLFLCAMFFLMTVILLHPAVCVAGAASGLRVWFDSVLPSLFPFMVLTGLLIKTEVLSLISRQLTKIRLLRRFPVEFLFAAATGLLCGYPMGIRTVCELRESGQLSPRQASLLISFANQAGPMFVLGYALPMCGLDEKQKRQFLIAFYGGIFLTALLSGIVHLTAFRISGRNAGADHTTNHPASAGTDREKKSFFHCFEETILSSMTTLAKIGGYMMLFSLFSTLMKELIPNHSGLLVLFSGLLEMTSGIAGAPVLGENAAAYAILGFVSFGGLSVTAQSFSLGKLNTGEQLRYLLWKTVQAILSVCLLCLLAGGHR